MKGKRYSEEQIVRILKEGEGGKPVAEVCRACHHPLRRCERWAWVFVSTARSRPERAEPMAASLVR